MTLDELKKTKDAPDFLTHEGYETLTKGYLLENETPKGMYKRLSKVASDKLKRPDLEDKFFSYLWKNWLCPSTPISSNLGTSKGLPISCFGNVIDDSIDGIFKQYHETAMLTKNGGGIGSYYGNIRSRGTKIGINGTSEGIVPWLKVDEQTIQAVAQGQSRRGAKAIYLDIEHGDIEEFIDIRKPNGDLSRKCLSNNFHHAVCISDEFMNKCKNGDTKSRNLWEKILRNRIETGEPYLMFKDNANNNKPQWYKDNNQTILASQLCNEIYIPSDVNSTYVCCLSSLNLARWDEWKDTDLIETSIYFLDGVIQDFIDKGKNIPGLEKAVKSAEEGRTLGLGVLGWHTLLQSKMIPFDSFEAMQLNNLIFKTLRERSDKASQKLAKEYGECIWTKGYGVRNANLLAIAPTVSNALISGGYSQGIEPIISNIYSQKTAKGTFIRKNPILENILENKNINNFNTWNLINSDDGSVKNINELTNLEKEVFQTAREINQFAIIKQAAQRQRYIDQGQSVNLFFSMPDDIQNKKDRSKLGKYIHDIHMLAWESGLKGLYYLRSTGVLKGDSIYKEESECKACEG
jgi:ribonucleoside-diphosphate reductase alpha chain